MVPFDYATPSDVVVMAEECPFTNVGNIASWISNYGGQYTDPNITPITDSNEVRYLECTTSRHPFIGLQRCLDRNGTYRPRLCLHLDDPRFQNKTIPFAGIQTPRISLLSASMSNPIMRLLV